MLLGVTTATSVLALNLRPKERAANQKDSIDLETLVPKTFGNWLLIPKGASTVNPQTQELLDKLYSQILERTYRDADGYQIMLAIAYGGDQRGNLEAHKPEVCYPAQGFKVTTNEAIDVQTPHGKVAGRRLDTVAGARREPLIYWFTVADSTVDTKFDKRLMELKLILTGQIPDGLLFRVSSIDPDPERARLKQEAFVRDMLDAVPATARARLAGIKA